MLWVIDDLWVKHPGLNSFFCKSRSMSGKQLATKNATMEEIQPTTNFQQNTHPISMDRALQCRHVTTRLGTDNEAHIATGDGSTSAELGRTTAKLKTDRSPAGYEETASTGVPSQLPCRTH